MTGSVPTATGVFSAAPVVDRRRGLFPGGTPMWLLPVVAAVIVFAILIVVQPLVASYTGLTLVLTPLIPLVFAVLAQMFVIAGGDIDLGIGSFIGLVNVLMAVTLPWNPLIGIALILLLVVVQTLIGVLITVRRLPSIVVTLGMSFVWLGIAIVILPTPGGAVPAAITSFVQFNPPVVPAVVFIIVIVTALVTWLMSRTRYGVILRGVGSNADGIGKAGWSVVRAKGALYALAALFGVLSALYLSGQTGGADPYIAQSYVLLSIAGVIVGGGSFRGGEISVVGSVAGALVIGLLGSLLQFLGVSSDFQLGAQGLVLVLVLILRSAVAWVQRVRSTR